MRIFASSFMVRGLGPGLARVALVLALGLAACTTDSTGSESPAKSDKGGDGGKPGTQVDAPKADLPPADQLLARHVEVSGGADKIAQFQSLYVEGTIDTGKQKLRGTSKLWWKGGKFYVEEEIEGIGVSMIGYDGTTLWMKDPINGLRKLEGREKASYVQASSSMFPAHDWQKFYSKAQTRGQVDVEGKPAWEVVLTSKEGPDTTIGLDVESGRIRFIKSKQISNMGETPFDVYSSDYRPVLGYEFAFESRASISGLIEISNVTTKFEPNVEIDDAKFAYPSTQELVPADPAAQPPIVAPDAPKPDAPKP